MTLETSFRELTDRLRTLSEALHFLQILVVEDKPQTDDAALVDILSDAMDDLVSTLRTVSAAAATAYQCVVEQKELTCLSPPLTECQAHFYQLECQLSALLSYGRVAALIQLGRERSGEWPLWTRSVREALESIQEPVYEAKNALSRCWQEALASAISHSVVVTNTAIGIQFQPADAIKRAGKRPETRRI